MDYVPRRARADALYRAIHRPLAPVSGAFRALAFRRGRDETANFTRRSALVLAPHPDDETLGCGAAILHKRTAGTPVRIVVATDGRGDAGSRTRPPDELVNLRRAEAIEACSRLGVGLPDLHFLDFEDGHLAASSERLDACIRDIVRRMGPEEILVPALADRHPDHRALSQAVRRLIVAGEVKCAVYEYPIWYWQRYPWVSQPKNIIDAACRFLSDPVCACLGPRPALVRTDGVLERKRAAIRAYRSQTGSLEGEPGWWTFPQGFVAGFLGSYEIFFPVNVPA